MILYPSSYEKRPFCDMMDDSNNDTSYHNGPERPIPIKIIREKSRPNLKEEIEKKENEASQVIKNSQRPKICEVPIKIEKGEEMSSDFNDYRVPPVNHHKGHMLSRSPKENFKHISSLTIPIHREKGFQNFMEDGLSSSEVRANKKLNASKSSLLNEVQRNNASKRVREIPIMISKQSKLENVGDSQLKVQEKENDPIEYIKEIDKEVMKLKEEIERFNGSSHDKHYRYLDEMLTRYMIKLDNIDSKGKNEIRDARKSTLSKISKCIFELESKASSETFSSNECNVNSESMQIDNNSIESSVTVDDCNISLSLESNRTNNVSLSGPSYVELPKDNVNEADKVQGADNTMQDESQKADVNFADDAIEALSQKSEVKIADDAMETLSQKSEIRSMIPEETIKLESHSDHEMVAKLNQETVPS